MIIFIFCLVAFLYFLTILNSHLRGLYKELIHKVLVIILIIVIIFSFLIDKWWYGLLSLALLLLLSISGIIKFLAKNISRKILGYRVVSNKQSFSSDKFMDYLLEENGLDKAMGFLNKFNEQDHKKLSKLYNKSKINQILQENQINFEQYLELFKRIDVILYDIVWEIFSSSKEFEILCNLLNNNADNEEIYRNFRKN